MPLARPKIGEFTGHVATPKSSHSHWSLKAGDSPATVLKPLALVRKLAYRRIPEERLSCSVAQQERPGGPSAMSRLEKGKRMCAKHIGSMLLTLLALVSAASVSAVGPALEAPAASCQVALGELNDEDKRRAVLPTIDGGTITSPVQLESLVAKLRNAANKAIEIRGGRFAGWDFRRLKLANVCFVESNLKNSRWDGVNAPGLGFVRVNLEGATLRKAVLPYLLLRETTLTDADMTSADISSGKLDGDGQGSFVRTNLSGARLRGFRFDCSIMIFDDCGMEKEGLDLRRADLSDADIQSFPWGSDVRLDGAKLDRTTIGVEQIRLLDKMTVDGPLVVVDVLLTVPEVDMLRNAVAEGIASDVPSFPCSKAISKGEKVICSKDQSELRRLDRQLALSWRAARAIEQRPERKQALEVGQKVWFKEREACAKTDEVSSCVADSYWKRIGVLDRHRAGDGEPLKIGETRYFIEVPLPLPDAFWLTPLSAKLTPAFLAASASHVVVTRAVDGAYAIKGESTGGNAHTCTADGQGLRYDRENGWYGGVPLDVSGKPAVGGRFVPAFQLARDHLRIFGDGHPDYEQYPDRFADCGARAYFSPMRRIHPSNDRDKQFFKYSE
jgi:uncharacterized protein YjbI with pentapeptide repeats/uncharacterized protein